MNANMSVQHSTAGIDVPGHQSTVLHCKHTPATWRTRNMQPANVHAACNEQRGFALCAMQHMSVADTVLQCIAHQDKRHMLKLKKAFRLSDRRWCWLQVRGTLHPRHTHACKHACTQAQAVRTRTHTPSLRRVCLSAAAAKRSMQS
jgi:hypothetical protein